MDTVRLVDPANLRWLSPGRTWEEDSMQRAFVHLGDSKWRDAIAALEREEQLVRASRDDVSEPVDEDLIPEDIVAEASRSWIWESSRPF